MMNSPLKLWKLKLDDEPMVELLRLRQVPGSPNHAFSIFVIFSDSANASIPRDTSPVIGESLGNTCK
jgi:hypothetical protein